MQNRQVTTTALAILTAITVAACPRPKDADPPDEGAGETGETEEKK